MRGIDIRASFRATWTAAQRRSRSQDLLLSAAGVTFYATLAAVPTVLVAVRAATLLAGPSRVLHLGHDLADALPHHRDDAVAILDLFTRGAGIGWTVFVIALFPASLYGEGLRRALAGFGGGAESFTGWRGRLSLVPLLVLAPGLLLALLAVTPWLDELFGHGGWADVGGVVVAFTADWLVTTIPLIWVFRVVSPDPPRWPAAALGGLLTASFVAGFLQGFVLFLSLPLDLGKPFGGLSSIGALCALELWVWLLHIVILVGYLATRSTVLTPRCD